MENNGMKVMSAPTQTVTPKQEPETNLNPLDDLGAAIEAFKVKMKASFDEVAALARKVKKACHFVIPPVRRYGFRCSSRTANSLSMFSGSAYFLSPCAQPSKGSNTARPSPHTALIRSANSTAA